MKTVAHVLADHAAALLLPAPCIYRKIAFDSLTQITLPWRMSIEANSFETVQSAIRAGLGVTILPVTAIREDMPMIKEGLPELPNSSLMSYLGTDYFHPSAQRFIDFLVVCLEEGIEKSNHAVA